jgi:hypothetical protein
MSTVFMVAFVRTFGIGVRVTAVGVVSLGVRTFGVIGQTRGMKGVVVRGVGFGLGAFAWAQLDGFLSLAFCVIELFVIFVGGFGFFGSMNFLGAFVGDFDFVDLDGVDFLFVLLVIFLVVIEISAASQRVCWSGSLDLVVLGFHQARREGVNFLFAERGFDGGLIGSERLTRFV